MMILDTPIIWHTPSAVYACTVHTLLKVVSGLLEGTPETCSNPYSFLRLLDEQVKSKGKQSLKEYSSKIVVIKAPKSGHEKERYNIEEIALKRLVKEQHIPIDPHQQIIKGGAI